MTDSIAGLSSVKDHNGNGNENGNGDENGEGKSSIGALSSDDIDTGSVAGAALIGLSAIGALGLLANGGVAVPASSDISAPVAGDEAEGPATGPVDIPDSKR